MQVKLATSQGDIVLALETERAPGTAENFLAYVRDGFYAGTLFHRVVNGFVAQGGGLDREFHPKPTRPPIQNEADNGLSNLTGTVAMARTSDPHSASSQFFINLKDNLFLDHQAKTPQGWGYCVFARVVDGMDTVALIAALPTTQRAGHSDVPAEDVVIEHAEVVEET